jgi:hypothetical protein
MLALAPVLFVFAVALGFAEGDAGQDTTPAAVLLFISFGVAVIGVVMIVVSAVRRLVRAVHHVGAVPTPGSPDAKARGDVGVADEVGVPAIPASHDARSRAELGMQKVVPWLKVGALLTGVGGVGLILGVFSRATVEGVGGVVFYALLGCVLVGVVLLIGALGAMLGYGLRMGGLRLEQAWSRKQDRD